MVAGWREGAVTLPHRLFLKRRREKKTHTHSFSAFNHFPDQSPSLMPAASGLGGSPEIHKGKTS